jgi:hypothetical protein
VAEDIERDGEKRKEVLKASGWHKEDINQFLEAQLLTLLTEDGERTTGSDYNIDLN